MTEETIFIISDEIGNAWDLKCARGMHGIIKYSVSKPNETALYLKRQFTIHPYIWYRSGSYNNGSTVNILKPMGVGTWRPKYSQVTMATDELTTVAVLYWHLGYSNNQDVGTLPNNRCYTHLASSWYITKEWVNVTVSCLYYYDSRDDNIPA